MVILCNFYTFRIRVINSLILGTFNVVFKRFPSRPKVLSFQYLYAMQPLEAVKLSLRLRKINFFFLSLYGGCQTYHIMDLVNHSLIRGLLPRANNLVLDPFRRVLCVLFFFKTFAISIGIRALNYSSLLANQRDSSHSTTTINSKLMTQSSLGLSSTNFVM